MLFKAPRHLNWVAGDIVLLLLALWGGLFAFSVGRKRWMGFLCVFLAAAINILTGFAGSPWGGAYCDGLIFAPFDDCRSFA